MVCTKCEKKLKSLANPDVWRDGGKNSTQYGKAGARAVGQNMLLKHKQKERFNPYQNKCKICRSAMSQQGEYCPGCAYKQGVCQMCGKKMVDVSMHNQTMV